MDKKMKKAMPKAMPMKAKEMGKKSMPMKEKEMGMKPMMSSAEMEAMANKMHGMADMMMKASKSKKKK